MAAWGWSRKLAGHISSHRELRGKTGTGFTFSKSTPVTCFLSEGSAPQGSVFSPNSGTSWGPGVQIHESAGDIPHLNHRSWYPELILGPT